MRIAGAWRSALAGLVLLAGASSAFAQWQVGVFTGQIVDSNERYTIEVSCEASGVCEYAFTRQPLGPGKAKRRHADRVEAIDVEVPNRSLRATRESVKANARAYSDKVDGPLLRDIRPLLESAAQYAQCVGEPATSKPWGRLCSRTGCWGFPT